MKKLFVLLLLTPFLQSKDSDVCDIKLNYETKTGMAVTFHFNKTIKKCEKNDILELTIKGRTLLKNQEDLAGWSSVYCVFEESVVIAGNKLVCRLRSTEYRKLRFLGINQD